MRVFIIMLDCLNALKHSTFLAKLQSEHIACIMHGHRTKDKNMCIDWTTHKRMKIVNKQRAVATCVKQPIFQFTTNLAI